MRPRTGGFDPAAANTASRWTRANFNRAALVALVVVIAMLLFELDKPRVSLSMDMASSATGTGEVFYASGGNKYSERRKVLFHFQSDGQLRRYTLPLPSIPIDRIRIDPGKSTGSIRVKSVEIANGRHSLRFSGPQLQAVLGATHHVQPRASEHGDLEFRSIGRDPYFEIKLPATIGATPLSTRLFRLANGALLAVAGWLLLEYLWRLFRHRVQWRRFAFVERTCRACSDDDILRVDARILASFAVIVLMAACYVALGLNQSSIGWWERIYPYQPVHQALDLGTPKRIRSDEWKVQTPWVLNQVQNGSPLHNPGTGGDHSPLVASLPVEGAIDAPQIKFAGFHFLGIERGVSWWWAYKSFALLFGFLWLCLLLTRGNLTASLLGTAWIYASSYTQWWLSSNLPEIMSAFAFGVIGAIYAMFSSRRSLIAMGCVLVAYSAANLVLNLYPPFIIPLGYLGVAIVVGFAIQNSISGQRRSKLPFRSAAIFLATVAIAAYVVAFMGLASESIDSMLHTKYPGQRVADSGGVPLMKLLYGYFEAFRFDEFQFPSLVTNASEASSFVFLAPLILLAIPLRALLRTRHALLVAIASTCALIALWVLVDLPGPIERILQTMGWSLVTPKRAVMALGVGSILACTVLFSRMLEEAESARSLEVRRMSVVVVLTGLLAIGWGVHQVYPGFFSWKIIAIGTISCTLMGAGIILGRTALLVAGLCIYALPTLAVNPLVSGISAVTEKPILKMAAREGPAPEARWAVIGDPVLAQGLKAHGLSVFAGSQFLPVRDDLQILDPENRYEAVWNRYATINLLSNPGIKAPAFKRKRGDEYSISLDVCQGELQALGISHLAYTTPVPAADRACLRPLPTDSESGVKLFRLKR